MLSAYWRRRYEAPVVMARATIVPCLLLAALATSVPAAQECIRSCKAATVACIEERCTDSDGAARRVCRETCRGIGGCANIRTLAYVETVCRTDPNGMSAIRQTLKIRRGNCAPVTVMELPPGPPMQDPIGGACRLYGDAAAGVAAVLAAPFQRLGVSPDARSVVFEVTNEAPFLDSLQPAPSELEGMWYVRSDGTGLRRLGLASRDPRWQLFPQENGPFLGLGVGIDAEAVFSPNGRTLAYTDLGPGSTGEEAPQVWVVDLASGMRRQITRLPPPPTIRDRFGGYSLFLQAFLPDDTIVFAHLVSVSEGNVRFAPFVVKTDAGEPQPLPVPDNLPGGVADPTFAVIGVGFSARAVLPHPDGSVDLFLFKPNGKALQLTNLHSHDLRYQDQSPSGRRLLFITPDDPLGTNPSRNCQLFSITDLGAGLRQLTDFRETELATSGCNFTLPRQGCSVSTTYWDRATNEIVFYSNCDPFGTNPRGGQLFAIRPDGSQLRQLTAMRGLTITEDGSVTTELPGPFGYSSPTP